MRSGVSRRSGADKVDRLPFSLKILLENLLRFEDGVNVTRADIEALLKWDPKAPPRHEIAFTPARVIMQDFTGVPCIVDLAAMREAIVRLGGDPQTRSIRWRRPNWSSITRCRWTNTAPPIRSQHNNEIEFKRNGERYMFLRWGQNGFQQFQGGAAEHRHRAPGQYRAPGARDFRGRRRRQEAGLSRTPWSAPIRTPPWSMDWACSAGASAASRPRRPCSASR